MKTSTLRKLPVPFVVACLLGVGVLSFLLFSSGNKQEKTAQAVATPSQTSSRAPADSSRYGSRSGVAKLVRSSGNSSRTSPQTSTRQEKRSPRALAGGGAKKTDTSTKKVDANTARQELAEKKAARQKAIDRQMAQQKDAERRAAEQKLAERKLAERKLAERKLAERQAAERQAAERQRVAQQKQAEEARVAATTPPRRDQDRVKSATVATTTTTLPAAKKSYSPENPDPSELLSQALRSDNKASAPVKINEPDTVMPPGFDSKQNTVIAPTLEPSKTVANTESQAKGSSTKSLAAGTPDKSSVVNGELKLDADPIIAKRVRIINPSKNSLPVWFVTQKHKIQLKPGQRYEISTDKQLHIRFARGGNFGVGRVVAGEGDWVFSVDRTEGWKLTQN